jgi:hypothetical protein
VRVSPRTGASERIVLDHCTGTRRGCVPSGEVVKLERDRRCSRAMARGLEMRVLDDVNVRSLAGFG